MSKHFMSEEGSTVGYETIFAFLTYGGLLAVFYAVLAG